jgi:hypothetical protein
MKKIGSRAEVYHGTALKTSGGLLKENLLKNKHGYIVSKRKVALSRKSKTNPLMAQGFLAKKNSHKFGHQKLNHTHKSKKSMLSKIYELFD